MGIQSEESASEAEIAYQIGDEGIALSLYTSPITGKRKLKFWHSKGGRATVGFLYPKNDPKNRDLARMLELAEEALS